jgi:hypothetical protein
MTREERIIEGRRKLESGDFHRAVTSTSPLNFEWNRVTLECGHEMLWDPVIIKKLPARMKCHKCAEIWLDAAEGNQ